MNDDNTPVTRAELEAVLDSRLSAAVQQILDRTQEMVRDAQTELLRAYERQVRVGDLVIRKLKADQSNFEQLADQRLDVNDEILRDLQARVLDHEARLKKGGL